MPVANRRLIFNLSDPSRLGLLQRVDSQSLAPVGKFFKGETIGVDVQLVQATQTNTDPNAAPFEYVEIGDGVVELALGPLQSIPTGGSVAVTGTGSIAFTMAYDASAATVQAAIDADGGGWTASKVADGTWLFRSTGTSATSGWNVTANTLTPESSAKFSLLVQADGSSQGEVWSLTIEQRPYVHSIPGTDFPTITTPFDATQIVAGNAVAKEVQEIAISPTPIGGTFTPIITLNEKTQVRVMRANDGALAPKWYIWPAADSSGASNGKYFDIDDADGVVRVWMTNGTGVAPAVPSGGRLLSVTFADNDTAAQMATAIKNAVDADSKFTATLASPSVTITCTDTFKSEQGDEGDLLTGNVGASDVPRYSQIEDGSPGQITIVPQWFKLWDNYGSVGVVCLDTTTSDVPAEVLALNRYIVVDLAPNDSASTVATAIASAVDADAQFGATASGQTVEITSADAIPRTAASNGTSSPAFVVSQLRAAVATSPTIPFDATAQQFQTLLGNGFTVAKTGEFAWQLTFPDYGAQSLISVDASDLSTVPGVSGTMLIQGETLELAFADVDSVECKFEARYTPDGGEPQVIFQAPATIYRSVMENL